jgi:transcriptional regulator with XRE-family HTH domain
MAHNADYTLVLQRLRTVRKVKGWTLHEVEQYSHGEVNAIVLGSWERGTRKPSLERLLKLCNEIYRVPLSAIVSGSNEDFIKQMVASFIPKEKVKG